MTEEQALREWADQYQADKRLQWEARMEERAKIVAWLEVKSDHIAQKGWLAAQIKAGEHLK